MLISMLIKWKLANFLKITKFSTNPINDEEHKHMQYANKNQTRMLQETFIMKIYEK